ARDDGADQRMPRARFLALWPLKYKADRWTVIRMRLAGQDPPKLAAPPAPVQHSPASFAQHVRQLRRRLPAGFTVVVEPPFVVLGDEAPHVVRSHSERTVRWAVRHLRSAYFARDPTRILDVWLFGSKSAYERYNRSLFGAVPDTPFGYYS